MRHSVPRVRSWLAAGFSVLGAMAPLAAEARGFVSFGFGVPLVAAPPPYYYPPPAYYYPPPTPYGAYPPPASVEAPPVQPQSCREYRASATIDGRPQQTYGTACLQPDGTWRIVR
jgi:hypothetical protein